MASVTLHGNPLELSGTPPTIGDEAPAFDLVGNDMASVKSSDSAGKVVILSVVPSIDTPVCSVQTARFNKELDSLPENVVAYTVSIDTPFAQKRWCAAEGAEKMTLLSDYKGNTFGRDWGLYLNGPGILARSVFIIGKDGKVAYSQLVPEISQEPNYDEVLQRARELAA